MVYLGVVVESQPAETVTYELDDVVRVGFLVVALGSCRPQTLAVAFRVLRWVGLLKKARMCSLTGPL